MPFINPVTCPLTHQKKIKGDGIEAVEESVCLGLIIGIIQTGWSEQRVQTPSRAATEGKRKREREELISTYGINYHLFNFINEIIN